MYVQKKKNSQSLHTANFMLKLPHTAVPWSVACCDLVKAPRCAAAHRLLVAQLDCTQHLEFKCIN